VQAHAINNDINSITKGRAHAVNIPGLN
jgi:hypothetical protein